MEEIEKLNAIIQRIQINTTEYEPVRYCKRCKKPTETEYCNQCFEIINRLKNIPAYLKRCGVPERFLSSSFSNFQGDKKGLENISKFDFVYLYGGCGTGKTHLAVSLARKLATEPEELKFITSSKLFLTLRASFRDQTEDIEIKNIINSGLLVIDDLGAEKISDYVAQCWYEIINSRYNDCRKTIITSNLSLKKLYETFGATGDRIASRIAIGTIIELNGADYRTQTRGDKKTNNVIGI